MLLAPILGPPGTKSRFIGKDSDNREDWRREEKAAAADQIRQDRRLYQCESEQVPGDREGLRSLACCGPRGGEEADMASRLKNSTGCLLRVSSQLCGSEAWDFLPSSFVSGRSQRLTAAGTSPCLLAVCLSARGHSLLLKDTCISSHVAPSTFKPAVVCQVLLKFLLLLLRWLHSDYTEPIQIIQANLPIVK